MSKQLVGTVLCLSIATLAAPSFAQLGGLGKAMGGGGSSVSAEALVQSYVGGTQQVMSADVHLLSALGKKSAAEREALAAKNLTSGATTDGLRDAALVQTEGSKTLEDALGTEKVAMSAESKKMYVAGVIDLVKGVKTYAGMTGDVQNFKPGVSSIGAAGDAALYVAKSLPTSLTNLKNTLKRSIDFAKANKIVLPDDATKALNG
ncbi:hypothetical protein [Rugamonas sp.]|uniref:hypothetical protein n=1 Tax=Rugamonas sp. TaxID=1926287 RepID=UPI0025D81D44|nr:hypothetical protein [Rugamonas sp.]